MSRVVCRQASRDELRTKAACSCNEEGSWVSAQEQDAQPAHNLQQELLAQGMETSPEPS